MYRPQGLPAPPPGVHRGGLWRSASLGKAVGGRYREVPIPEAEPSAPVTTAGRWGQQGRGPAQLELGAVCLARKGNRCPEGFSDQSTK